MLAKLRKTLLRPFSPQKGRTDWSQVGTHFIGLFTREIDLLAERLSVIHSREVRVRFDKLRGRVELKFEPGEIIAWIRVEGDVCCPEKAIIRLAFDADRAPYDETFPKLLRQYEPLSQVVEWNHHQLRSTYVGREQRRLEKVAAKLSREDRLVTVHVLDDPNFFGAEFVSPARRDTVARVKFRGECGAAYEIILYGVASADKQAFADVYGKVFEMTFRP